MSRPTFSSEDSPRLDPTLESTASLLTRARAGDAAARNLIFRRHMGLLRRWARGRLPDFARGLVDTDDLVQMTMVRALDRLEDFEPRRSGAFLAYLRQILLNQIRDQIRRVSRRPGVDPVDENLPDGGPSPLDHAVGKDALARYEAALTRLPADQQEAILLRVEGGVSYQAIAEALQRPSANAARLLVTRALVRLAREMREHG